MSERWEASLWRRRMISLRVIYTDDTYFTEPVKTFFEIFKIPIGISRQQVHRIGELTINRRGLMLRTPGSAASRSYALAQNAPRGQRKQRSYPINFAPESSYHPPGT